MKERWAESVEHQAVSHEKECYIQTRRQKENRNTVTPGLDNTRLFIGLTAGAGTRCMSLLSSSPSLKERERLMNLVAGLLLSLILFDRPHCPSSFFNIFALSSLLFYIMIALKDVVPARR